MWRFLIRRMLWAVFLIFAATFVTYAIFFLIPGDPAISSPPAAAPIRSRSRMSAASCTSTSRCSKQYGRFLWNLVAHGSLGVSYINRGEVRTPLMERRCP